MTFFLWIPNMLNRNAVILLYKPKVTKPTVLSSGIFVYFVQQLDNVCLDCLLLVSPLKVLWAKKDAGVNNPPRLNSLHTQLMLQIHQRQRLKMISPNDDQNYISPRIMRVTYRLHKSTVWATKKSAPASLIHTVYFSSPLIVLLHLVSQKNNNICFKTCVNSK